MHNLISALLERKVLVSPDIMESLSGMDPDSIASTAGSQIVLTSLSQPKGMLVHPPKRKGRLSPQDVSSFYLSRLSFARAAFGARLSPISVNKAPSVAGQLDLVGIVRERLDGSFILEDQTGSIEVRSKSAPAVGDAVGIRGHVREGIFFEKEFLYPDIQLNRKIGSHPATIILSEDHIDEPADHAFAFSDNPQANPARIVIGAASVLAYKPAAQLTIDQAAEMLRKRSLMQPADRVDSDTDYFFVDKIPDVFFILSEKNLTSVYRGVLIVLSNAARIDLDSKHVEFVQAKTRTPRKAALA